MTLTTRLAIVEPTPVREVFDECRRLLGGERARYRHEEGSYCNEMSQGLPAWLDITYGVDAPLTPDWEYAGDPDERRYWPPVDEWSIVVSLDTAYAYRGPHGGGCGDLHAWLIREVGRWLSERGLSWYWYDEFNAEWHPSSDPVTLLGDPERGRLPDTDAARAV
jgi:hypothetical protein